MRSGGTLTRLVATLIIAASATILFGSAGVTFAQTAPNPSGSKVQFQVVAPTSTTTVATTTTTVPTTTTTTGVTPTTTSRRFAGGGLPLTGGSFLQTTMTAVALTVLGVFLVAAVRRRRA